MFPNAFVANDKTSQVGQKCRKARTYDIKLLAVSELEYRENVADAIILECKVRSTFLGQNYDDKLKTNIIVRKDKTTVARN